MREETNLAPRPLSPNGQTERMTPTAVSTRLLQPLDVIKVLSPEVVLNLHVGQGGRDIKNLLVAQVSNLACRMDVKAGKETGRSKITNTEEGLERFLVSVRPGVEESVRSCLP